MMYTERERKEKNVNICSKGYERAANMGLQKSKELLTATHKNTISLNRLTHQTAHCAQLVLGSKNAILNPDLHH